jgi:hypothetical protein
MNRIPSIVFPMSLLLFFFLKFFGPLSFTSQEASRPYLLKSLCTLLCTFVRISLVSFDCHCCFLKQFSFFLFLPVEILKAPFGRVAFRDQFIGDIFTSLIRVFIDLERSLCFYLTGSWLSSAPPIDPGILILATRASVMFVFGFFYPFLSAGSDIFDAPRCHTVNLVLIPILSVLPLWLRFQQTIRRYF